jgi:ribosomal protein S18 acetylase RimI-like enzyme
MSEEVTFRRPVEADHRFLVDRVDEWWGGRKLRHLLPRLWLRHFTGTSWIAEDRSGAIVGFLVGFISPDDPAEAYIHMAATSPNHRRAGLGRALYDRFLADARARGACHVTAVTWPGNQVSVGFHRALGFTPDDGPGTQRLYGTPAYPDYDGDGQDRVVFSLEL